MLHFGVSGYVSQARFSAVTVHGGLCCRVRSSSASIRNGSPPGAAIINPQPAISNPFIPQLHPFSLSLFTQCRPFACRRSIRRSLRTRCSISSTALSAFRPSPVASRCESCNNARPRRSSALHTDVPGRVDKATVLQALQTRGESYDRARETLKHVSVDASGKVELEDWVEVRHPVHPPVFSRFYLLRLTESPSDSLTLSSALRLLPLAPRLGRSPCKVPTQTSVILLTRMSDESSRITSTG